jgi:tetratricopeptide (TPR) repeat protein
MRVEIVDRPQRPPPDAETGPSLAAKAANSRPTFLTPVMALGAAWALSSGNKARDQKRWGDAIEAYSKVVRLRPEAANIWVQLGHCLKESGNTVEAEKAYLKGLELDPENPDTLLHVGRIKRSMNDQTSALHYLERAAGFASPSLDATTELRKLRSSSADRALSSGNLARDEKRWAQAIEAYDIYLAHRPDAASIWMKLGHCWNEMRNAAEAEKAYLRALELEPENPDTLLCLGRAKQSMNDPASAARYFERAATAASPSAAAREELKALWLNRGAGASAGDEARDETGWLEEIQSRAAALGRGPDAASFWVQLGNSLNESGKGAEAEKAYLKALELDPQNALALVRLGRVKQSMNDVAAAERHFARAAALPSATAEASAALGDLRSTAARVLASADQARIKGRWREAIDAYREFLSFRPGAADVWVHLGDCLRRSGDDAEAEKAYLRSRELDPKLVRPGIGGRASEPSKDAEGAAAPGGADFAADRPAPTARGERESPQAGGQPHALRLEFGSRPQRPLPDSPGAVGERASGGFLSEIAVLPAGRYRARVQIVFSELAKSEPVVVNVQSFATGRVLDQVELTADLNNRAVADRIYLSFTLEKAEAVEFYGWVGAHCESTLLRLLTILDDPTGSAVASDFDFSAPTQPSIRDLKIVNIGTTGICNASCLHCPTNKKGFDMPHGRMSLAVFEKIIRELAEGGFTGQFNFGLFAEPLEDTFLFERLKIIKKLLPNSYVAVATNGALYDPQKHWELMGYIDNLAVHVEALNPEVYNRLMHPLKAERVIPKINHLIEDLRLREHMMLNLVTPVHNDNISEVAALAEYARVNGVYFNFAPLSSRAWEGGQYPKLSIAPVGGFCRPNVLLDSLFIDFDGLVVPCCFDFSKSLPLGDLNRQTIQEMFASPAWQSMFDTFKGGEWSSKGACSRCRVDDGNAIADLVDRMTTKVERSGRRFRANAFRGAAPTRRNPDGGIVADSQAPDGMLVYGPYERAAPGRYRVYHDIRVIEASPPCAIDLYVRLTGKGLAHKRIAVSNGQNLEATIDFEHADDDLLEFSVHKSGNIAFEYKGARLLRL